MKRRGRPYAVGPDDVDLLLLKAALSNGDAAREAWQEASQRIGSISGLNGATYRLLPLLYRNLCEQGVDDPELKRLKGVYRHSWYVNHMLFHEAGVVLGSLEQARIDTIVLKGGALARLYYDAPGTRPMGDLDVLVRRRQVRQAMEVLDQNGWTPNVPGPIETQLRMEYSSAHSHPRGQELDLHWSPFWQPANEQPFWDRAIPLEIGGTQTRALCPEDQLLHVCVHGVNWSMRMPYWAADAAMLIRSPKGMLDWQRLVEQARANELSMALEHGLRFLGDNFELDIPSTVLEQLSATPRSRSERLAQRMALTPRYQGKETLRSWDRYRRYAALEGRRASLAGFVTHERQRLASVGIANRRQLFGLLLTKCGQVLRHGAWPPKELKH